MELMVSAAVAAVIMAGLASAMLLASHALPDSNGPFATALEGSRVAEEIAEDLRYALSFTEQSATAVTFTVADRTGDSLAETIRYAWSGTPGDSLTRQYNGGTAVTIADNVEQFALTHGADFSIDATHWAGECFRPALPPDTVNWRVNRISFQAKRKGPNSDGMTKVQLRDATGSSLPGSTVFAESLMFESNLDSNHSWQAFDLDVADLSPSQDLCLVLEFAGGTNEACDVLYRNQNASVAQSAFVHTSAAGGSWTPDASKALLFYVYGTVSPSGEAVVVPIQYVSDVGIGIRVGPHDASRVDTAVRIVNEPEVTVP